jgi:hypothetical protein
VYIAEDLEAGRLVEVQLADDPALSRESAVVRHAHRSAMPPAAAVLVEAIRRRAREIGLQVLERGRKGQRRGSHAAP